VAEAKLRSEGSQLLGVGIAGQPLCLGVGLQNGTPGYVSVVTNSGNPYAWQFVILGSNGQTTKVNIGTQDGQFWWIVPGGNPFPDCVSLIPGQGAASTIIVENNTLNAAFGPGGFLAPTGGPSGFYFATNNEASAPVNFFATS
jgi:hypothetical protein